MATWSGIRAKLEDDYLADSLKGHIRYYCTSYSRSPDHEGRAAIYMDGQEVISGCYYNNWFKANEFPKDDKYNDRMDMEFAYIDNTAVELGVFDQRCFYEAFNMFDNQPINESLISDNLLVRILAILDRRVGKRRLVRISLEKKDEDRVFNTFLEIRLRAENLIKDT